MKDRYPRIDVDLGKLRDNIDNIVRICRAHKVEVAGVIKGFSGLVECVRQYDDSECSFIASSRLDQLRNLKAQGIRKPLMMIRIPMLSEAKEVVEVTDMSLNSEIEVLRELDHQAGMCGKKHKILLMIDLGDLREGFWGSKELIDAALCVENDMENLELSGVGTNLGCYGAIDATVEKMEELVKAAEQVERAIGRRLRYISGGATTSLPRILENDMPKRVNLLRIGEGIILSQHMCEFLGYDMEYMHRDVFTLKAEVIEIKDKPTKPVGKIVCDCFGRVPVYEDHGIRKRTLLGVGRVDYAFPEDLTPLTDGVKILGASSDHTILDIEDAKDDVFIGAIIGFKVTYSTIVYLTNSRNVVINYLDVRSQA